MSETRFTFRLTAGEPDREQIDQALQHYTEWASREACPKLWQLTDLLRKQQEEEEIRKTELKPRSAYRKVLDVVCVFLGLFALAPALKTYESMTPILVAGLFCLVTGVCSLLIYAPGVIAGIGLATGALLALGAALNFAELGRLLLLGAVMLAVGIFGVVKWHQKKTGKPSRSERKRAESARKLAESRAEIPADARFTAVFAKKGLTLEQDDEPSLPMIPYGQLSAAVETRDLVLVVTGDEKGLILEKDGLETGRFHDFRDFLTTKTSWLEEGSMSPRQ